MMRFARTGSWCAALALSLTTILTACTEEEPTGIGGDLLPGGNIESFEVILEPEQYLVFDTAFSGYTRAATTGLLLAAREFEGVYNANTLVRFSRPPRSISVRNSAGNVVSDTMPIFFGGEIIIRIDTVLSTNRGVAPIAAYTIGEEWHATSATWTDRVDTSGVRVPWSQAGGTRGVLLGRGARSSADTVFIPIDSAAIADWADLDSDVRGAIIALDPDAASTVGERIRLTGLTLRLSARSTIDTDTVVSVFANPTAATFVFDPQPPATATPIRVGGVPAWRTFMQFREDLHNLEVPCPSVRPTCTVRLGDADITRADLVLESAEAPAGFAPEDTVSLQVNMVLRSPNVPVERSPLVANGVVGVTTSAVLPSAFRAGTPDTARISLTGYFRALAQDNVEENRRPSRAVALLTSPESSTAGVAAFARRPRLHLILTVDPEVVR